MRISTTLLESYRLYRDEDWMEESDLIASIKREAPQTRQMQIGLAYEAILESPQKCLDGCYEHKDWPGFRFEASAIESMLDLIKPGLFQVKTTREFLVPGAGFVTLVAKADHIHGASLTDFKTTLDAFNAERYLASVQWRAYTLLFGASLLTYHVALLREEKDWLSLRSIESLNVYPYPQMEQDCRALIKEFAHYVKAKGLDGYLREKFPVSEEARMSL